MYSTAFARSSCRHRLAGVRPSALAHGLRVFTSSPLHLNNAHARRPPARPSPVSKADVLLQEQTLTKREQRKADWAIMKEMSQYLWPKDSLGTRMRVGLSVGLLVGAKLLNVQVPFYFKNIIDAMNIDFLTVGGTAATVAGSMIVACKTICPYLYATSSAIMALATPATETE